MIRSLKNVFNQYKIPTIVIVLVVFVNFKMIHELWKKPWSLCFSTCSIKIRNSLEVILSPLFRLCVFLYILPFHRKRDTVYSPSPLVTMSSISFPLEILDPPVSFGESPRSWVWTLYYFRFLTSPMTSYIIIQSCNVVRNDSK